MITKKHWTTLWIGCLAACLALSLTPSVNAAANGQGGSGSGSESNHARNAAQPGSSAEHGSQGEAGHGGDETNGGLLSVQVGSYIWKIIIFTLFMIALGIWVWPPILKGLQDREEKQRNDLQTAETAANEANQKLDQYRQQLADAQKQSQQIIEQSRSEAKRLDAQLKEQTQQEIQSIRDRASSEIESAKEQAIAEMYEQTAVVATQIAGRILQRELRPEDHRDLVDRAANDLTSPTTTTAGANRN